MRPSVLHGLEVQSECGFECDFPRIVRSGVLHGLEIQRECGFECDYMRILLAHARSHSLSFGDYARKKQSEFEIECESVIKLDSPPV